MSKIAEELEAAGYRGSVESFDELLVRAKVRFQPNWTVDRLLAHPGIAMEFCGVVRSKARAPRLYADTINRRLLGLRKKSRYGPRLKPKRPAARSIPFNLERQLQAAGYRGDPASFQETMIELLALFTPNWTVDELIIHTSEAQTYCQHVRHRTGSRNVPDWVILGGLLNARKRSLLFVS